jgi:hypothetical protein
VEKVVGYLPSKCEVLSSNPNTTTTATKKVMYINIIKAVNDKPVANIVINVKETETKIKIETRVLTLSTLIQYSA